MNCLRNAAMGNNTSDSAALGLAFCWTVDADGAAAACATGDSGDPDG